MKLWMASMALVACLPAAAFELVSQEVADGKSLAQEQVFKGFGCDGGNVSPSLSWSNAPAGTKSFAVTVYDPDAPTGSGWWHWTVFNIPASVSALPKGTGSFGPLPKGAVQGRTDFGAPGFGGACPPVGAKPHRYEFTVWALNTERLPLDEQASGALVGFMLNAHSIGKAQLTAIYGR